MKVVVKENKMITAAKTRKTIAMFSILLVMSFFASGQVFAWTTGSTFEGGSNGALANGSNGFTYSGTQTFYDNTQVHSGSMAARMHWTNTGGAEGFTYTHGEFGTSSYNNELWIRGYFYFPAGFRFQAWPYCKFIRAQSAGGSNGYVSVEFNTDSNGNAQLVQSNEPSSGYIADIPKSNITTGTWHYVEQYVKFGNPGIQRIWLDGVLKLNDTSHYTGTGGNLIYIMTQWNGWDEHFTSPQDQWIDDIVITTDTPANRDANNYPMIGPTSGSTPVVTLPPPLGLKVTSN